MATYFMFGSYTSEAIKSISADRTEKAGNIIKSLGGQLKSAYALMGEKDLVLIIDFPDIRGAVKTSIALNKLTGIAFSSSPAIPVEEFDKITKDI